MSCSRPLRRAVLVAAGLSLLVAGPASAHPFIQGGEAPVDSLAQLTLSMAHGCASEVAGEGEPTIEIAMEVPDWMRIVDVPEEDGWSVTLEPDDVEVEVVTWADPEAQAPAPAVTFDAVVSGEPGDERFLAVFQGCANDSYRWIGTPDEPADDPAVRVRLVAADPDRPAPPPPTPAPGEEADAPDVTDADPEDGPDAGVDPDSAADETDGETDDVTDGADAATTDDEEADGPEPSAATDPTDGSDGLNTTPIIVAVVVLVLGGLGGIVLLRRRNAEA